MAHPLSQDSTQTQLPTGMVVDADTCARVPGRSVAGAAAAGTTASAGAACGGTAGGGGTPLVPTPPVPAGTVHPDVDIHS